MSWPALSDGLAPIGAAMSALPPTVAPQCTSKCFPHSPSFGPSFLTHANLQSHPAGVLTDTFAARGADLAALAQQTRAQAGAFASALAAELDRLDGCVEALLVATTRSLSPQSATPKA